MDEKNEMLDACLNNLISVIVELFILIMNDPEVRRSFQAGNSNKIGNLYP
jgi:hypothetical protein